MIILPLSAASVATYYTWTPSYASFLVLSAVPISLRFFYDGGFLFNIMGFLTLFFIAVLLRAGKVMHAASVRSFKFGIRNEVLNTDLKEVIAVREQLNARLQLEIAERKLAEIEIKKLSKVFLDGTNPTFIEDLNGNIQEMNDEAVNVYGFSREELVGRSIKLLVPDEKHEQMDDLIKLCMEGELVRDVEGVRRKKDGNEIPVLMTMSLLTDEANNPFGIASIASDISEQKNIEKELIKSKTAAEIANAAKDKFFSIISHDLIGAFSTIFSFVKMMKKNRKNLSEEKITMLYEELSGTTESSYKLLDNLLQWARSQTGKIQLNKEKLTLQVLVHEMFEFTGFQAAQKKINLESEIQSSDTAFGDKNMVQTVIRNLITNAIKFTPQHGKIIVRTEKKDDHIQLSISDTGVGINQEKIDKLFRIDTQVTSKGTENEKGSGLGLILCKEFVERNGGEIWVESEIGKGTTIRFTLPMPPAI
jgi:PAS domain S-box-containing protein